jgi:hypothetical protein
MTDYALVGKKGTGKSKNAVRLMRDDYLGAGRTVATNLDINLRAMFGPMSKKTVVRVPDKPCAFDLEAAGSGNPLYDESKNGGLFLDELGTWLNSRAFGDKSRAGILDFMAHARKHGWDTFYIMQNVLQIDKQVRESFLEFTTRHTRFDKVRIPIFGGLISLLFGKRFAYLPRFHTAVTRLGTSPSDLKTDSLMFKGDDLHDVYDTRQVFREDYPHGTHSLLSPWHLEGRFLPVPVAPWWKQALLAVWRREWFKAPTPAPRPVRAAVARPDASLARVVALCRGLPPDQALQVVARYMRATERPAARGA